MSITHEPDLGLSGSDLDALISSNVRIGDRDSIGAYLASHPDMAPLVTKICALTAQEFGGTAQVSLELYRDPESASSLLLVCVRQQAYTPDLVSRTAHIMQTFGPQLADSSGWIQVTTDFQPPR
jgi:hypothetical protein